MRINSENREEKKFERIMQHIIRSIEDSGYSAEDQILAYVLTDDENYITRNGNARDWIQKLDKQQIEKYFEL